MAVRQQPEQQTINQIFLTDDDVRDLLAQRRDPTTEFLHLLRNFLSRFHEFCKTEDWGRTFESILRKCRWRFIKPVIPRENASPARTERSRGSYLNVFATEFFDSARNDG